ncbi:MAG: hypothetical protein RLZ98_3567 [Pseudomonadota bacterium]|jgi:hypothetical protein
MPEPRPYASYSVDRLQEIVANAQTNQLKDILRELDSFRTTKAANRLAVDIREMLADGESNADDITVVDGEQADLPGVVFAQPARPRPVVDEARRPKYPPTDEQQAAIEAFKRGGSLKILAFAGAGKTSTLQHMAFERLERGIYLAFNRSIANEARSKFPLHVDTRTTHSLAARQVRGKARYTNSKMFDRIGGNQLADILQLEKLTIEKKVSLGESQQAYLIIRTVRRFCSSEDPEIQMEHIPMSGRLRGLSPETSAEVKNALLDQARVVWERMKDPKDEIPLGHDGYLVPRQHSRDVLKRIGSGGF